MEAIITTNKGTMKVSLYTEDTPKTVANFVKLAKDGFYNGLKFHRVLPDFVIQGGCPNSRDGANGMPGTGGPGYKIDCEVSGGNQYHDRGVLSMAHAGRNTAGSQFFVCHSRNNTAHLDGNHTCFGKVIEGLDVIDAIRQDDSIDSIEIVEAHHAGKIDSPSGTAVRTAELISEARDGMTAPLVPGVGQEARGQVVAGIPIHSIRLAGVSAKQEVILGGESEVLTISHEVSSIRSYVHGILMSIRTAAKASGLIIGLQSVVDANTKNS